MNLTRLPPLTSLRAFEAAARHGSLSAAGRELNVTHAAIAQQVKRLETLLDVRLLDRAGRGVAPTGAGADLARALTTGFATMLEGVDRVSANRADRPLCVTMTPTFAVGWLMPRIGAFRTAHPEVELMINPTAEVVDLADGECEVAFRYGRGRWPGFDATRMVASDVVVVAAPDLLARRRPETPRDLVDLPWVQEAGTDEVRHWLAGHGVDGTKLRNVMTLPGSLAVDAVRAGHGVGLMARTWVERDLAEGALVTLFEEVGDPALGYYLVHRPGPHRGPLKAFLTWVRREMRAETAPA